MPRTKNNSLDYFPLDTSFFSDSRIRRLRARFGSDGPLFLIYIFCRCYGEDGYYVKADNDFFEDAALDIGCSVEKIGLMLDYLLDRSLLDSKSFNTVKVLTSHGIQAQYQKSKKGCKRDIEVMETLWLLNSEETEGFIKVRGKNYNSEKNRYNSEKKSDNSEKYPQSKVKESKVKHSLRSVTRAHESAGGMHGSGVSIHPTFEQVLEYAKYRGAEQCAKPFFDYYSAANWRDSQNIPVYNWKQKFIVWQMWEEEKQKRIGSRKKNNYVFDPTPSDERIQENNDWLDKFLAEQRKKEEQKGD